MKRKGFKRFIAASCMLAMTMSLFAGCSKKEEKETSTDEKVTQAPTQAPATKEPDQTSKTTPTEAPGIDTSKEVTLKMYLVGDGAPDVPVIYDEVNKMLKEKINATIEPTYLSWAEVNEKYPVIAASGEDFDLIFSANWIKFTDYARNGAFYEITDDMLNTYAPLTVANTDKAMIDGCRLQENGKLFMLGMNSREYETKCYMVRGDIMKIANLTEIKNFDDLVTYMEAAKTIDGIIPFDLAGNYNDLMTYTWRYQNNVSMGIKGAVDGAYIIGDTKVLNGDEYRALQEPWLEKMVDLRTEGMWTKNAPMAKYTTKDSFKSGKSAACIDNLGNVVGIYESVTAEHPDWDVKVFPLTPAENPTRCNPYTQNGMSIGVNSKNPERALMALDLLRNDKTINQTTTYGIEGVYWKENNGEIELIGDQTLKEGYPADQACPWGWRNDTYYFPIKSSLPNQKELKQYHIDHFVEDPLLNFVFDPTPVQEIHDALASFKDDRSTLIDFGLQDKENIKPILDDIQKQKEALGVDEYHAEIQKQIDAYLKK